MRDDDRVRIGMVDAADWLGEFVEGRNREDLDHDRMLPFAVVRAIEILGEAASKISAETQAQIVGVPWASIVGMRNRLIHGYFDVDTEIVWATATVEVPALLGPLRRVLSSVLGLANAARAVALIDRLTHHAEIAKIDGDSFRKREAEQEGQAGADGLDHGALAVRDVARSVAWYQDVLGLERRYQDVWARCQPWSSPTTRASHHSPYKAPRQSPGPGATR